MNIPSVSVASNYKIYNREPVLPMTKFGRGSLLSEIASSDPIIIILLIAFLMFIVIIMLFMFFPKYASIVMVLFITGAISCLGMISVNSKVTDITGGVMSQIRVVDRLITENMKR